MFEDAFRTGRLLLSQEPSASTPAATEGIPFVGAVLVVCFVLLAIIFLRSFLDVLPYLADSVLRARGSTALENSVRVSRERNVIALILLIPACLLLYRYRIYDPGFVQGIDTDIRMLIVAGAFFAYLLLRFLLYLWLRPRRRYDNYQMSYRAGYTFFILLLLLVLPTVGLLYLFHASDLSFRTLILVETGTIYLLYLLRRGQILSASCNPLTTFLYLCALELLPTGLLVASATLL